MHFIWNHAEIHTVRLINWTQTLLCRYEQHNKGFFLCFTHVTGEGGADTTQALECWGKDSLEYRWKRNYSITDPERFPMLNSSLKSVKSAQPYYEYVQAWDISCTFCLQQHWQRGWAYPQISAWKSSLCPVETQRWTEPWLAGIV